MLSINCGVWSAEENVECGVWGGKSKLWSLCKEGSVECRVWSEDCNV